MMRFRPLLQSLARRCHPAKLSSLGVTRSAAAPLFASHTAASSFSTKGSSTALESDLQHKLLQRLCWEAYLGSGRGSTTLFKSIDVNTSGTISREDLMTFLNSVEGKGGKNIPCPLVRTIFLCTTSSRCRSCFVLRAFSVNPKAFQILDVLADDHRIDLREFKSWLIIATKFGSKDKNSRYKASLDAHPELGERQVSKYADEFSWNEVTMTQSLRRL